MKYILLMNTMKLGSGGKAGTEGIAGWPKKDVEAHIAYMMDMNRKLMKSGEFAMAEGLAFPDQAKSVRAGTDGRPITDGVFPESKEFLAGFWIVDVESPERAYEIAAQASAAPRPGGVPLNMSIEVRPVLSRPPKLP